MEKRSAGVAAVVVGLAVVTLVTVAHAVPVVIDTSALAGQPARLEFSLLGFDGADGNNTVTLSTGIFGTPEVLSDAGGLGQLLLDLTLGNQLTFDVVATTAFDDGGDPTTSPDRFMFFVLDPDTNFTLFDTNLEGDALLVVEQGVVTAATDIVVVGTPTPPAVAEPSATWFLLAACAAWLARRARAPIAGA